MRLPAWLDLRRYRVAVDHLSVRSISIRGRARAIRHARAEAERLEGVAVVARDLPEARDPRVVATFDCRPGRPR